MATLSNILKADTGALSATKGSYRIDKAILTPTEVKALFSTPISLVVSQGAGTVINVHRITFASTFLTTAYAGANNLEFRYTDASGAKVTADIAAATLNFTTGTKYALVAGVTTELTQVPASPIVVRVPTANPTAGLSTVTFYIEYSVLTAP
jgi:hypothetical protein